MQDLRVMNNWQPIETAPKDGTRIIVTNGDEMEICSWGQINPVDSPDYIGWIYGDSDDYSVRAYMESPTHWMNAPKLPNQLSNLRKWMQR
jgi:hypothetical protein